MAAKKKKSVKVVKMLTFNKANAKLFADNIYSDNHGRVTFLKLCNGELSNGKDGGRTLHCALGEAYFTFVDPHVAKYVNGITKNFGTELHAEHDKKTYNPKYSNTGSNSHIPTLAVVDALVDAAQLRSKSPEAKKRLAQALFNTMEKNDDACGVDIADELQRSQDVADMWRDAVIPLLK